MARRKRQQQEQQDGTAPPRSTGASAWVVLGAAAALVQLAPVASAAGAATTSASGRGAWGARGAVGGFMPPAVGFWGAQDGQRGLIGQQRRLANAWCVRACYILSYIVSDECRAMRWFWTHPCSNTRTIQGNTPGGAPGVHDGPTGRGSLGLVPGRGEWQGEAGRQQGRRGGRGDGGGLRGAGK